MKRLMLIGVVVFGLISLLQAQAMAAYTLPSGDAVVGCAWKKKPNGIMDYCCYTTCRGNCYWFQWVVTGGSNPNDNFGYLLATDGKVLTYATVCKNPGGDLDVRQGVGGITLPDTYTPIDCTSITNSTNGKTVVTTFPLCERMDETDVFVYIDGEKIHCWDNVPGVSTSSGVGPTLFEQTWGIGKKDCRNSNWTPYSFALLSIELTGTLYNNCELGVTDPTLGGCDPPKSGASVYCETKTPPRTIWTYSDTMYGGSTCDPSTDPYCKCVENVKDPDGNLHTICTNVSYLCVNSGSPIAWDDSYSVRMGRTLTVSAPGVLGNDHDTGTDASPSLTANLYTYVNDVGAIIGNVSHGTLILSSSGGFTYTPNPGFLGVDSFTYRAYDGVNYSNVATVTITVTSK